jgi:hypothetical protein
VLTTLAGGGGLAMEAWGAYCEALYAQAILTGSVRVQAKERTALHRHLGGAYAPETLAAGPDSELPKRDGQDGLTEAAFLSQRGVVGLFVRHKLLEWLNAKLDHSSPSLLLGIDRRHDEDAREEARIALLSLLWEVTPALPERLRLGSSSWPQGRSTRPPWTARRHIIRSSWTRPTSGRRISTSAGFVRSAN